MNEARIRLAEAMGWTKFIREPYWLHPSDAGKTSEVELHREVPDPFTDANDCDALKKFMQSQGWCIDIDWQHLNEDVSSDSYCPAPAIYVEIWHCATEQHERYDTDLGEPYTVAATVCRCLGIPLYVEDSEL